MLQITERNSYKLQGKGPKAASVENNEVVSL